MNNVKMLTVVPIHIAEQLKSNKRVENYNTLPQLNTKVLERIRKYMTDHVGYSNLPIACLVSTSKDYSLDGADIMSYLPVNGKTSVLFQLEMPEDMIVSANFEELLEISENIEASSTAEEAELYLEDLDDILSVSSNDETKEINFIPFLDLAKCKFYAKFDENFGTEGLDSIGLGSIELKRITSFID